MSADSKFGSLQNWQEWERTLLPYANRHDAKEPYFTDDESLGDFVCKRKVIEHFLERFGNRESPLRVLEVGCGQGANLLEIYNQYQSLVDQGSLCLAGTLLQPIPHKQQLPDQIEIMNGLEIQQLPAEWENSWDIVLTQRVLGWVHQYGNLDAAFKQIRQILRPGGIWIGLESYNAMDPIRRVPLNSYILGSMTRLKMLQLSAHEMYFDILGFDCKERYGHNGYVYYKPRSNDEDPSRAIYQLLGKNYPLFR